MKVTDVNVEVYRWARQVPIRNGRHTYETSGLNVIKVETDEGACLKKREAGRITGKT